MKTPSLAANAVHVIYPHRHPEDRVLWGFDDACFGFIQEPFVFGASQAVEMLTTAKFGAVAGRNLWHLPRQISVHFSA